MHIHGNAQDQLGQIMKAGKLVVHGDVGQTFMYGAKGGEIYIRGNAPGRPLINAVGSRAIYIRDPEHKTVGEQFNGGHFHQLADADWALIKPDLVENEKLFGIKVDDLLRHNGTKLAPEQVYRKVGAMKLAEAAKIIADDDVNLGMIDSVGRKNKRKKGAA